MWTPTFGREMAAARAADLVAAGAHRRTRRPRGGNRRGWRLSLGRGLVGAGLRLLGEPAPSGVVTWVEVFDE